MDKFRSNFATAQSRKVRLLEFWENCLKNLPQDSINEGLTLEIGCGHGHWLVGYAEKHPLEFCIGIDLITKRIEKACAKLEKRTISRIFFLKAEANEFVESIPNGLFLKKIFFLFPDPWPKKRHHKRRLIQPSFLDQLESLCENETELFFRTDHEDYYQWVRSCLSEHPAWDLKMDFEWPFEHESFFQMILPQHESLHAVHSNKSH